MTDLERFKEMNSRAYQQDMLSKIAELRGYKNNDPFNYAKACQIRDEEIQAYLFKDSAVWHQCFHTQTSESLVYGKCVIPGFAPTGELITYIAYSPLNQLRSKINDVSMPAYFYPEQQTSGGRKSFLYAPPEAWERIINSRYIYVVDGVWDSVVLNLSGVPTLAILSSSLTSDAKRILKCFDEVYLVMDNDRAGSSLYKELLSSFSKVYRVVVPPQIGKDADDYYKAMGSKAFIEQLALGQNIYLSGGRKV
jgi:5S rRNA maturation endonuclease (ribonuclease M5)